MGALAPGPEDAQKQEHGADSLANLTHGYRLSLRMPPRQKRGLAAPRTRGLCEFRFELTRSRRDVYGPFSTTRATSPRRPAETSG